jgi:hypothetical protein
MSSTPWRWPRVYVSTSLPASRLAMSSKRMARRGSESSSACSSAAATPLPSKTSCPRGAACEAGESVGVEGLGARKPRTRRPSVHQQPRQATIHPAASTRVRGLAATCGIRPPCEFPRPSPLGLLGRVPQDQGHPPYPALRPAQIDSDDGGILPPDGRGPTSCGDGTALLRRGTSSPPRTSVTARPWSRRFTAG